MRAFWIVTPNFENLENSESFWEYDDAIAYAKERAYESLNTKVYILRGYIHEVSSVRSMPSKEHEYTWEGF